MQGATKSDKRSPRESSKGYSSRLDIAVSYFKLYFNELYCFPCRVAGGERDGPLRHRG